MHPLLQSAATYTPHYSTAVAREHARLDASPGSKISAIDLTRYEALSAPAPTDPTSDEDKPGVLAQWNTSLKQAYTSAEYVSTRLTQLGLLETYGRNAWLVGNSQLGDVLGGIEAELAAVRAQADEVGAARRAQQESVRGEMGALEEAWRKGVGRVLEVEVAGEAVKEQILERRRAGAV